MLFFMINLAFANPNEEQPQKSAVETSQTTNQDSEFDFLTEKKEKKAPQKDMDFDDSEFMIDASLMDSNDRVLVPQADDTLLLPEKETISTTEALPEDTLILSNDIALEEDTTERSEDTPKVDINSTDSYDALMGDLE